MPLATYTDFSGGKNTQLGPIVLDTGDGTAMRYCDDAQNFQMSTYGLIKYSGDVAVLNSALSGTTTVTGQFEFVKSDGTLVQVVCSNGYVYTISGGTATQIYSGDTAGYFYQAVEYNNTLLMCNGHDKPLYYDGTTCAQITFKDPQSVWNDARPFAVAILPGRNRVFWATTTKLYTPQPGSYLNFDNTNGTVDSFNVDIGYGGNITGIKALTDDLFVIYKERCIRRLSGSDPFANGPDPFHITTISDEVGCIAPRTIVQVGLEHYFLGQNGLRQLRPIQGYGDLEQLLPTYPIQDDINGLNFTTSAIVNACAVYHQPTHKIYYCVPNGAATTNDTLFCYDIVTKANEPRGTGINGACIGIFNRKIYTSDYAGQVYKHGDDNGYNTANFTAYWQSKLIAHQGLTYKRYKKILIYAEALGQGDIVVNYTILKRGQQVVTASSQSVDPGANVWDVAQWDVATWSTSTQQILEINNPGRGQAIALKLTNTSNTEIPKIRQIDIEYEVFGVVKG